MATKNTPLLSSSSPPTSDSINIYPAPWNTCKASTIWYFPIYNSGSVKLSKGFEDQNDFAEGTNDEFTGGFGMIQVVRYTSTPCGPYDELIYIPGFFKTPFSKTPKYRITRIYVSNLDTLYNGRKNWGIPKHLAVFNFNEDITRVEVSLPPQDGIDQEPFFIGRINKGILGMLSIPITTWIFPMDLDFQQPPLNDLSIVNSQDDGKAEVGAIGTKDWFSWSPYQAGKISFVGAVVEKCGNGDGKSWPESISGLWSLGIRWGETKMQFSAGKVLKEN